MTTRLVCECTPPRKFCLRLWYASTVELPGRVMTLTFDLWPWTFCKQRPLTWWIFVASLIEISPSRDAKYGRTNDHKQYTSAACWWRININELDWNIAYCFSKCMSMLGFTKSKERMDGGVVIIIIIIIHLYSRMWPYGESSMLR